LLVVLKSPELSPIIEILFTAKKPVPGFDSVTGLLELVPMAWTPKPRDPGLSCGE
jgi:hypothetical protein